MLERYSVMYVNITHITYFSSFDRNENQPQ